MMVMIRFEDVFRLTLGPSPVHMTYEFIEEVPEICRHSHEQALLVRSSASGWDELRPEPAD